MTQFQTMPVRGPQAYEAGSLGSPPSGSHPDYQSLSELSASGLKPLPARLPRSCLGDLFKTQTQVISLLKSFNGSPVSVSQTWGSWVTGDIFSGVFTSPQEFYYLILGLIKISS